MITGYIADVETNDSIEFRFFDPIENNVDAVYEAGDVRGRSEPHHFYVQTGPDTYAISLHLVASVDQNDEGTTEDLWLHSLFIKSFQYPDYGLIKKGMTLPPKHAILILGNFFEKTGIIKGYAATWNFPNDNLGYPHSINCRFTFEVVHDRPLDYKDIRAGY